MSQSPDDFSREQEAFEYWRQMQYKKGRLQASLRLWLKKPLWRLTLFLSHYLKRTFDMGISLVALMLLSPLFLLVALLVKIEDGGPLFFKQTRVGFRGRPFQMWKFRSMVRNAEELKKNLLDQNESKAGVIFKMKNDPRVTRVGKWLRKFSIDEMPQLYNVLKGEMSLVGPRPAIPKEVEEYGVQDRLRLCAKPGITCFWQVSGRSNIDFHGQVRLDISYIQSESLWTDFKLLLRTIPAVLFSKGAY